MKRAIVLYFVCFVYGWGFSQDTPEFPTVAPPTPTAASLHTYGNNNVNYYSGTTNVSIPLYTVESGGIQIPITLDYNGGNGIKVEEQASWVGLGWTLNAGGAVSRIKRGVADEHPDDGFFTYSELPREELNSGGSVTNADLLNDIRIGKKDGEPDKFMYNTPSGSGGFFINYDETIYQKPFRDVLINYGPGNGDYVDAPVFNCNPNGTMNAFYITDEQGMYYSFEEKERSSSRNIGGEFRDKSCFPTSWHLTKVTNATNTVSVGFDYDAYSYKNVRLNRTIIGLNETESYTEDYFLGKYLSHITFLDGSVEFIRAATERKDMEDNHALEKIVIKDLDGNITKEFHFSYKYFTANALVDDNASLSYTNTNRLVLSSVQEVGTNGENLPPYSFTYNTDHYLPSTESKAKDHWGYYNGANSNTKFQAKQLATYYNGVDKIWETTLIGSANRESNPIYCRAGILTKVSYPTGGSTLFEYEGNTAVDDRLQGNLEFKSHSLIEPNTSTNIYVTLFSQGLQSVEMEFNAIQYPSGCIPIVKLTNIATNEEVEYSFEFAEQNNNGVGGLMFTQYIAPGNYDVSFRMQGPSSICNPTNFDYFLTLSWQNETDEPVKNVGGVRIKRIIDNSINQIASIRNFDYTGDDGNSSGSIVSAPKYWFQNYTLRPDLGDYVPLNIINRSTASHYPLTQTSGNVVGYDKVTVTERNGENGKTEYYFSSPKDFPDKRMGYIQNNGQRGDFVFQGALVETYPVVTENSREYVRGKLLKQVTYKYNVDNGGYEPVSELTNTYKVMSYDPDLPGQEFPPNKSLIIKGIKIADPSSGQTVNDIKEYEIHSGYMQLEKTVTKNHFDSGMVETTQTSTYREDSDFAITHMVPIGNELLKSTGERVETETYYVFNEDENPDKDVSRTAVINDLKNNYNRIYLPTQVNTRTYDGTTLESTAKLKNQYGQFPSGAIHLENVLTAKQEQDFDQRLVYHAYDNRQNPLEISKDGGPRTCFVWGYNKSRPIAKLVNASYDTMTGAQNTAINEAIAASDADTDASTENSLRNKLKDLRDAFPNTMVTTFTYDLQVGVTSVTDERGYTNYFRYDGMNRLKEVRDANDHIVSDYKYTYQNQ